MKQAVVILFFLCNQVKLFSQVSYEKSESNILTIVQYHISDSERLCIKFDKVGQVASLEKFEMNKLNGFQYYFTRNKLDSIRRYDKGSMSSENYFLDNSSDLEKLFLPNGLDLDSVFYLNNRKSKSGKAVKLSAIGVNKIYELDSNGVLRTIHDCDSNYNIFVGYTIYLSNNGYRINRITNQLAETIVLNNGYLQGIYTYKAGRLNGFRLLFRRRKNGNQILKEFTILTDNIPVKKPLQFRPNGTIK